MGLVALVHWGVENPVVRYALLPVFLVFEVLFYGFLEVLSERTHELFPFWAVVTANTLAAVSMGFYLWRRHPAFRRVDPEHAAGRGADAIAAWQGATGRPLEPRPSSPPWLPPPIISRFPPDRYSFLPHPLGRGLCVCARSSSR